MKALKSFAVSPECMVWDGSIQRWNSRVDTGAVMPGLQMSVGIEKLFAAIYATGVWKVILVTAKRYWKLIFLKRKVVRLLLSFLNANMTLIRMAKINFWVFALIPVQYIKHYLPLTPIRLMDVLLRCKQYKSQRRDWSGWPFSETHLTGSWILGKYSCQSLKQGAAQIWTSVIKENSVFQSVTPLGCLALRNLAWSSCLGPKPRYAIHSGTFDQ